MKLLSKTLKFFIHLPLLFIVISSLPYANAEPVTIIKLPNLINNKVSVEEALKARRSIRTYQTSPLNIQQITQLLWAAQGITSTKGFRTAPSAGALYPLEIYLVVSQVNGLAKGIYHYLPYKHSIVLLSKGDKRKALARAALTQASVATAPINIIITAIYARTEKKYGARGKRYVQMEAGHAAQNILLEAVPLKLGAVTIGAFNDKEVSKILNLPADHTPLYIIPVGKKESA